MKVLGAALTTKQKENSVFPLFKMTLDATTWRLRQNKFRDVEHTEQEWSQVARIVVDNTAKDLVNYRGKKSTFSWGLHTDSAWLASTRYDVGDFIRPTNLNLNDFVYECTTSTSGSSGATEPTWDTDVNAPGTTNDGSVIWTTREGRVISACAPLWVLSQQNVSWQGGVGIELSLAGTLNLMGLDEASREYFGDSQDLKTIETLIREICAGGFSDWVASTAYSLDDYVHPTSATWAAATGYSIGDIVTPTDDANGRLYTCTDALTSSGTEPSWPLGENDTVADGAGGTAGVWTLKKVGVFRCTVSGDSGGSEPTWGTTMGGDTADNEVTWIFDGWALDVFSHCTARTVTFDSVDSAMNKAHYEWAASTTYALGDYVRPTEGEKTGYAYKCTTAGISGSSEPSPWDTDVVDPPGTTSDGTVTWTTEVIGLRPQDAFYIEFKGTRLAALQELMSRTGCSLRVENDEEIHIFVPNTKDRATIWAANTEYTVGMNVIPLTGETLFRQYKCTTAGKSGGTEPDPWGTSIGGTTSDGTITWTLALDYFYSSTSSSQVEQHPYYNKSYREHVVIPNKIVVESDPSHSTHYRGSAEDSDSVALIEVREFYRYRLGSDANADLIADNILKQRQRTMESGSSKIPIINIGAEVHDFNYFSDLREGGGGHRIGNVGEVFRYFHAETAEFGMALVFGRPLSGIRSLVGTMPATREDVVDELSIEEDFEKLKKWAKTKGYKG
ncbi:hypothetical protein LCGC14_0369580 [marine sediment metagenome]|uniref:Uncharacterized protein n=1 Tax=marine sediment metagenome TaxID=412755 RepID=A0A0F9TBA7_9ZZZZ